MFCFDVPLDARQYQRFLDAERVGRTTVAFGAGFVI